MPVCVLMGLKYDAVSLDSCLITTGVKLCCQPMPWTEPIPYYSYKMTTGPVDLQKLDQSSSTYNQEYTPSSFGRQSKILVGWPSAQYASLDETKSS